MNQALYRKYRSRSFKEVVGQEHITKTLEQAVKSGSISHAYLFTGPRGVGKTSVARILAHEVNGLPYKNESMHLDIIEIDAASNRRIDEIRDLRERVRIAPVMGRYKVYIIDEVHMLTREAFNALLKTLEEPPQHSIFILATTEAHKLPDTIISRAQRFEFKPISAEKATKHLAHIAKSEKIDIEPPALNMLAEFGRGSFRDSISYLDQLSSAGKTITESRVRDLLGLPSEKEINAIADSVFNNQPASILKLVKALKEQGVDASAAASLLSDRMRQEIVNGNNTVMIANLLRQLIEVPASTNPYDFLEICLLEAAGLESAPQPAANRQSPKTPNQKKPLKKPANESFSTEDNDVNFSLESWNEIVEAARLRHASIYTALRLARPAVDKGILVLRFKFPLHQKKASQAKNKAMIMKLIEDMTGRAVQLEIIVDKGAFDDTAAESDQLKQSTPGALHSISNVFGAAEVL